MEQASQQDLGLPRAALLARLERAHAKIVGIIAPAGFGKSTLARQFLQTQERRGICDCAGVTDALDLARRLIPALAEESPERSITLTQRELMLGDGGTSSADRVALALEAWKTPAAGPSFFLFENAEHVANHPQAREFFARLLSQRPAGRCVVICSRESLRLHLSRFALPHEILTLRAADLGFGRQELADVFSPFVQDEATLDRIADVSQGWPIAIFLLQRFANEGRITSMLESLSDVAFEELHDYLADQVLSSLERPVIDALFACACIPQATDVDLAVALIDPHGISGLATLAAESPFVSRTPQFEYVIHPLVTSLLLENKVHERNALLARTAAGYAQNGHFQRAAELHLARGDPAAAAQALGQYEVIADKTPSMQYSRVLASLDRALVQKYPRLWAVTALLRIFAVDTSEILDEAETLWRMLPPATPPLERFYIFVFRVLFMSYLGMFEEAEAMVNAFAAQNAVPDVPSTPLHAYVLYLRSLMTARLGRLADAERDLMNALPICEGMDILASGTLLTLGADIARVRGERALERQFIERALEYARHSVLQNFVAFDLAEAAFGAWLAGEDDLFSQYASELDEHVHRDGVRGFAYYAAAARGRSQEPGEVDLVKWTMCGRLIASSNQADAADALKDARAARILADQYHVPFMQCLCAVAVALLDPIAFDETMAAAGEYAARVDSEPLRAAVAAIAAKSGDAGMLDAFVNKRIVRSRAERPAVLDIDVLTGRVRSMERDVHLSEKESALLIALSTKRQGLTRDELLEMLWPDLDDYAARNALSVCLHRLRQHLANEQAVLRDRERYRLHDDAHVDIWEIDRVVATMRSRKTLSAADKTVLKQMYDALCATRPGYMRDWEWFQQTERHVCELRLEVAQHLASDALAANDTAAALKLAHEMIEYDPCDEPAREIAITAYLANGDRAAALRHFRQYRETLQAELQCEPSAAIANLVKQ